MIKRTASQRAAAWRKANPERYAAWRKAWLIRTREARLVEMRGYAKANAAAARERHKKWREANPDAHQAIYLRSYRRRLAYYLAAVHKRRAQRLRAVPVWYGELDEFVVHEAAVLAKQRTKLTGFPWEVDHVVPLQSPAVCGLHVHNNLAVIPRALNRSKGNRVWPDMPN